MLKWILGYVKNICSLKGPVVTQHLKLNWLEMSTFRTLSTSAVFSSIISSQRLSDKLWSSINQEKVKCGWNLWNGVLILYQILNQRLKSIGLVSCSTRASLADEAWPKIASLTIQCLMNPIEETDGNSNWYFSTRSLYRICSNHSYCRFLCILLP